MLPLFASGYNPKRLPAMLTPKPRGATWPLGGEECRSGRVSVAGAMSSGKTADTGKAATWPR